MKKQYIVHLDSEEVLKLNQILTNGSLPARHHKLATALLVLNEANGRRVPDFKAQITTKFSDSSLARIRKNYAEVGWKKFLKRNLRPGPVVENLMGIKRHS